MAIGGEVDRTTLEGAASTGINREELVFETDQFEDIAGLLAVIFTRVRATLVLSLSTGLSGRHSSARALALPRKACYIINVIASCHSLCNYYLLDARLSFWAYPYPV